MHTTKPRTAWIQDSKKRSGADGMSATPNDISRAGKYPVTPGIGFVVLVKIDPASLASQHCIARSQPSGRLPIFVRRNPKVLYAAHDAQRTCTDYDRSRFGLQWPFWPTTWRLVCSERFYSVRLKA